MLGLSDRINDYSILFYSIHVGQVGHVGPSVLLTARMRMLFDVSWCEGFLKHCCNFNQH